ncbi:ROK family protein [Cryptosporangium sp. NPDC051539]|uniref:ROK family protein n=1 Tax=Cryptosporangium sp. NPDC051539 TaxID=3363962 RepID=UPI00379F0752
MLRAVASAGVPLSRADVATATGLTRAAVSGLVDALAVGRLLRETGVPTRTGVGRPSTGLVLDGEGPAGLGIELNVDHLSVCVVDLTGTVRVRRVLGLEGGLEGGGSPAAEAWSAAVAGAGPEGGSGPAAEAGLVAGGGPASGGGLVAGAEGRGAVLAALSSEAAAEAAALGLTLSGAALAVPGLVDPSTGALLVTPNLDSAGPLEALARLGSLRSVPIVVENEATLAARAEQRALGAAAPRSFLQVSGEVGIGAGLVLDGQLYRGRHGWSGELGHVTVRPGGRPCACGSDGCLEQYAGLRAISRAAGVGAEESGRPGGGRPGRGGSGVGGSGVGGSGRGGSGGGGSGVRAIAARAAAGEPAMLAALADAGEALGLALAAALNLLDLDAVVLGGAHAELAPWLVGPIEAQLSRRLVGAAVSRPVVQASVLGTDAAALGAAWSVLDRVLDDPAAWLSR